ncbi:MAG: ribonuclease [Rhodospirillales bacterium]|nr:ribonuclease [Rhodospirillales bacterium]
MAEPKSSRREAQQREAELRRERVGEIVGAMRDQLQPGMIARRAAGQIEWQDLRAASTVIGRTLRDNPIATLLAAGSLLWLAVRSRQVLESHPPRADLTLVPDREALETPAAEEPAAHMRSPEPVGARSGQSDPRGRSADTPRQIPRRGWKEILKRTWQQTKEDNISIVAAGVAFYALLAIFPALGAALSIYGFVADPADVSEQLASFGGMLPGDAQSLLQGQLSELTAQSEAALSFGALFGVVLALWSASAGVRTLMTALNIAYEEDEGRGFLPYYATAMALTLGAILSALVAIAVVAILPPLIKLLPLPELLRDIVSLVRWPILAGMVIVGLAVLYRYGPSRNRARWSWVSWGAVAATVLWIVGSILFSWYAANFANYNETYGSVGAIVALLMWFYLTAYVVLLGAELNSEMEHQTAKDTTRGPREPLGERGAEMADSVAA